MNYEHRTTESDDDISSGASASPTRPVVSATLAGPTESTFSAPEVAGDPPVAGQFVGQESGQADPNAEVENAGGEAGQESLEASPAQLAAETGEEGAPSDLTSIEGFEMLAAAEAGGEEAVIADAGEALGMAEADQAEFAFLAALLPSLASAVGPALGKAIGRRLKLRTRKRLARIAPRIVGAVTAATRGATKGNILSILAKLLSAAEAAPLTEAGGAVDEALAEEAAAVLEVIIDRDDRVRISKTTDIPWRRICALKIHFPSGRIYRGTGFFIGPRAIVTAGHCVYLQNQGGWARRIEVIPGSNGASRPFGTATATMFRSVRGWVVDQKPESDYGCIILPPGSFGGRNLGQFGFAAFPPTTLLAQSAVLAGYPGDKPFAELWGMARRIKTVTATRLIYDIDTVGGQSGSGIYIKRNGQRYVVGIHNYGAQSGNSATRITESVYQRLLSWRQL